MLIALALQDAGCLSITPKGHCLASASTSGEDAELEALLQRRALLHLHLAGRAMHLSLSSQLTCTWPQVHTAWPAKLARMCSEAPTVERLIQVSCLGAEIDSHSARLKSKRRGDDAVLDAFPDATIFRCGPMVGIEDRYYNDLALWRYSNNGVPVVDGGDNRVQPVYVVDVAEAIYKSLQYEDARGATYELGGPEVMTCAPPRSLLLSQRYRRTAWRTHRRERPSPVQ
jgi:hypothetical protein